MKRRAIEEGKTLTVPYESFERAARQFFPYARVVSLTLVGEPLMIPYLDKIIEIAERWQVKLEIFTNGQLWNEEKISKIAPSTASIVTSFDGSTPETFNKICLGADFNRVTRNLFLLGKWRKEHSKSGKVFALSLNVTLMKENISELPDILRIAKMLHIDNVSSSFMISFTDEMLKSILLNHRALANAWILKSRKVAEEIGQRADLPELFSDVSEQQIRAIDVSENSKQKQHLLPHLEADILSKDNVPEVYPLHPSYEVLPDSREYSCRFLWGEMFINMAGGVAPCCIQGRPEVGNINTETLADIWNSTLMQRMRRGIISGNPLAFCKNCNFNARIGKSKYSEEGLLPLDKLKTT